MMSRLAVPAPVLLPAASASTVNSQVLRLNCASARSGAALPARLSTDTAPPAGDGAPQDAPRAPPSRDRHQCERQGYRPNTQSDAWNTTPRPFDNACYV